MPKTRFVRVANLNGLGNYRALFRTTCVANERKRNGAIVGLPICFGVERTSEQKGSIGTAIRGIDVVSHHEPRQRVRSQPQHSKFVKE